MADLLDFSKKYRKQTATLWEVDGVDSALAPTFSSASPRQISVRWEERAINFIGDNGEEETASGFVVVGEDLKPGDWLYLGTSAASDPTILEDAVEIKGFEKVRGPSSRILNRICYLSHRRVY